MREKNCAGRTQVSFVPATTKKHTCWPLAACAAFSADCKPAYRSIIRSLFSKTWPHAHEWLFFVFLCALTLQSNLVQFERGALFGDATASSLCVWMWKYGWIWKETSRFEPGFAFLVLAEHHHISCQEKTRDSRSNSFSLFLFSVVAF